MQNNVIKNKDKQFVRNCVPALCKNICNYSSNLNVLHRKYSV